MIDTINVILLSNLLNFKMRYVIVLELGGYDYA